MSRCNDQSPASARLRVMAVGVSDILTKEKLEGQLLALLCRGKTCSMARGLLPVPLNRPFAIILMVSGSPWLVKGA